MAFSKELAQRIRKALEHLPRVEEKKMFGSLAFMVNGKLCLTAGPSRMMCRIDSVLYEHEIKKDGCTAVVMRGRAYKGYLHIQEENLSNESDFDHWIKLALDFNEQLISK
ncbi:TfoX/Sxy family protein [Maribacter sp. 2210JD10-5]|uniref:TfoX/Sxy family protein n=1 Tax=Maribacter sp. 2210JD10-5 TaxID=3386272 RepID=UPI0039BC964A